MSAGQSKSVHPKEKKISAHPTLLCDEIKIEAGTVIFAMVGISFERIGIDALQQLEPDLQGSVRKEIASKLREINSQRVTFESIEDRERYIRQAAPPLRCTTYSFRASFEVSEQIHSPNMK
jgi:hypothetical protein